MRINFRHQPGIAWERDTVNKNSGECHGTYGKRAAQKAILVGTQLQYCYLIGCQPTLKYLWASAP